MNVRAGRPDRSQWTVDSDWLSQAVLIVLAIIAPALMADDAWTFNYVNNVQGARPLYFNNGYVHLVPQLTGYALSGLPFPLQAILYRAVPLFVVLCLYRQLRHLFAVLGPPRDAWLPSLAIMFVIRTIEPLVFGELAYSTWTGFLAATIYVVRIHLAGGRYTPAGLAGVLLAALSLPLGVLLVPIWIAHAVWNTAGLRTQNVTLASVVAAGSAWILARAPGDPVGTTAPGELIAMFVDGFRDEKRDNLIAIAAAIVLAAHVTADLPIPRRRRRDPVRLARWSVCFIGVTSLAAFAISDRFVLLNGNFVARYTLPAVTCALLLSGLAVARLEGERVRTLLTGASLGGATAILLVLLYTQLRGPLEISLMRYRFLALGTEFRASCRGDQAWLFEYTDASPLLLCRPRPLAPGYHPLPENPPTVGIGTRDVDGLPGIFVFTPLF